MKKIYLIFLLLLNGCFYHDGCFYTPQMVNCVDKGKEYPAIAHYQKQTTIGKTDSLQRWKDAVSCGAVYGDSDLKNFTEIITKNFRIVWKLKGIRNFGLQNVVIKILNGIKVYAICELFCNCRWLS